MSTSTVLTTKVTMSSIATVTFALVKVKLRCNRHFPPTEVAFGKAH